MKGKLKSIGKATICMFPCGILWEIFIEQPYCWLGFMIIVSSFILGGIYVVWDNNF